MCRLAAYAGAALPLSSIIYDPPHGLDKQAYLPREMVSGHVNVDGTGVAWWRAGEGEPLLYASERPPWSDINLPRLATRLRGTPILAVVRSQTPGMPAGASAAHPFAFERWAGAHNGYLEGFNTVGKTLVELIDDDVRRRLDTLSDSLVLFLVAVTFVRRGATLAEALVNTASSATKLCSRGGYNASLNLVLADDQQVVALRAASGVPANSLYAAEGAAAWPGGNLIASEALDGDAAWRAVAENHWVRISADGVEIQSAGS